MKAETNGVIVHENEQRVVIATGLKRKTKNAKTGQMVQIWILAKAENPLRAIETGLDALICGGCPLRGTNGQGRTCYVNVGQAPLAVWRAYNRGSYPVMSTVEIFRNRKVRFGAYGDPVFIPFSIVRDIAAVSAGWTGYTHQWHNPLYAGYRAFVMASAETAAGAAEAQAQGWRTFRVSATTETQANEIVCPNTTRGISCADCRLCQGTTLRAKNIVIEVHGAGKGNLKTAAA